MASGVPNPDKAGCSAGINVRDCLSSASPPEVVSVLAGAEGCSQSWDRPPRAVDVPGDPPERLVTGGCPRPDGSVSLLPAERETCPESPSRVRACRGVLGEKSGVMSEGDCDWA
jgi:hypothetical protein